MDLDTLLKHTSRSLYLSVKILPASIRHAFGLAYLLCRYADTIADTDLLSIEKRLHWVKRFPAIVRTHDVAQQAALVQDLTGTSENPYEKELIAHLTDCLVALKQISPKQQEFIYEVVEAVCDGMEIDLISFEKGTKQAPIAFNKISELTHYCRLMGGKPGLFWSQLIYHACVVKVDQNSFYKLGQHIGDALQIVNVLRDLPKDLQFGRCYFPQEQLTAYQLLPSDLRNATNSVRFEPIKQYWLHWGKENLTGALLYFSALPKTALRIRTAVAWPILWTADTFNKLAVCPNLLEVTKRVKISRMRIYATMLVTPFLLMSNRLFRAWLCYKFKTLP